MRKLEEENAAYVEKLEPAMVVNLEQVDPEMADWLQKQIHSDAFVQSLDGNSAKKALWLNQIK